MGFLDCIIDVGGAVIDGFKSVIKVGCEVVGKIAKTALDAGLKAAKEVASVVIKQAAAKLLQPLTAIATGILGPVLGPVVAQIIVNAIVDVLLKEVNGMEDENADEIGYRINEAEKEENKEWSRPETFDSFKDYYEYLKRQIPDDKIKREDLEKNKYFYESIAVDVLAKEVGKQNGIETPVEFFIDVARCRMDDKEIRAIVETYKELGFSTVAFSDFLQGKLDESESERIEAALIESLKKVFPEKTESDLYDRLFIMERCSKNDIFMAIQMYGKELDDINENGVGSKFYKK